MTARTQSEYRRRLEEVVASHRTEVSELRAEALRPLGVDSHGGPVQEADRGHQAADENLAIALLGGEAHILAEATAALSRLDKGTFGACEGCGKTIPRARLEAIPYARHCIQCAQVAESAGGM